MIAIGSDHGGFDMKEVIKAHLIERGFEVDDLGTYDKSSCDYPVSAFEKTEFRGSYRFFRKSTVFHGAGRYRRAYELRQDAFYYPHSAGIGSLRCRGTVRRLFRVFHQ